jgi:hypothetical protein
MSRTNTLTYLPVTAVTKTKKVLKYLPDVDMADHLTVNCHVLAYQEPEK